MKAERSEIIKMRQEFLDLKEGALGTHFGILNKQIAEGSSGFLFDYGITAADLILFQHICHMSMGILDGIPKTYVRDNFMSLEEFRLKVAGIPEIKARFQDPNNRYHGSAYTVNWTVDEDEKE
eukprot:TRINITY_DN3450_c0_g1_i1.p1 TRINITY_DN3450_c0_g1~~TRINITY_DN3450_c0_g1_i1.p1  ORF type:complete len:123 (+),score=15.73 TRINITY_DN3450_c0_g1_i1:394-762(+)